MAIFVFKIIALLVRTAAKPMIAWATYYKRVKLQESGSNISWLKQRIVWLGQVVNYYNIKFNRKVFKLNQNDPIKLLNEDKAIEKGSECLSEILVYSILLLLPLIEWRRQARITNEKKIAKSYTIRRMRNDIDSLCLENKELREDLKELKSILLSIDSKI